MSKTYVHISAIATKENSIKYFDSIGKYDAAQDQREQLAKIHKIKESLFQLIYMDLSKPAQKMKEQAKTLG